METEDALETHGEAQTWVQISALPLSIVSVMCNKMPQRKCLKATTIIYGSAGQFC